MTQPTWFRQTLTALLERRDLSADEAGVVVGDLLDGGVAEPEAAALLIALRMKGETAVELAAAAEALRTRMTRFESGRDGVLDTCGTGGDGSGTFNVSTAAALVAAAVGVPVVKHGNRAVSGHSGSADVLRELGLPVEAGPAWASRCLNAAGLAFCFAPHFHPALARLADLRRRLGVRTLFNSLGPLANPAGAAYQLLGVGRSDLLNPLAGALARLGTRRALLVCGPGGFDEVSLWGPTTVRDVRDGSVRTDEWSPDDFGLESCRLEDVQVPDAAASAAVIRSVLDGNDGPALRLVLANTAAALLAAEHVPDLRAGVAAAESAVRGGEARAVLERLRACS